MSLRSKLCRDGVSRDPSSSDRDSRAGRRGDDPEREVDSGTKQIKRGVIRMASLTDIDWTDGESEPDVRANSLGSRLRCAVCS